MSFEARVAGNIFADAGHIVNFTAGANITKGQVVKITDSMTVQPASAATDAVIGIAAASASSGQKVPVVVGCPIVYATSGGAISVGAAVGAGTGGNVVSVATAGNKAVGFALEAATAAGQVILVALNPHVY